MEVIHDSIKTDAELTICICGYPCWLHEGKRRTCVVAGSKCEGFKQAKSPEWVEETPTPTATMTAHGHSHKRMTLTVKYDTDRRFPVYKWFKDGKPCESC